LLINPVIIYKEECSVKYSSDIFMYKIMLFSWKVLKLLNTHGIVWLYPSDVF